jgi:hypothetical protein
MGTYLNDIVTLETGETVFKMTFLVVNTFDLDEFIKNAKLDDPTGSETVEDRVSMILEERQSKIATVMPRGDVQPIINDKSVVILHSILSLPSGELLTNFHQFTHVFYKEMFKKRAVFPEINELLIGKKVGDAIDASIEVTRDLLNKFEREGTVAYQGYPLGTKFNIKFIVTAVLNYEIPEMGDEFAKDISAFDTIDELRDNIYKIAAIMHKAYKDVIFFQDIERQIVMQMQNAPLIFGRQYLQSSIDIMYNDKDILKSIIDSNLSDELVKNYKDIFTTGKTYNTFIYLVGSAIKDQLRLSHFSDTLYRLESILDNLIVFLAREYFTIKSENFFDQVNSIVDNVLNAFSEVNKLMDEAEETPTNPDYNKDTVGLTYVEACEQEFAKFTSENDIGKRELVDEIVEANRYKAAMRRGSHKKLKFGSPELDIQSSDEPLDTTHTPASDDQANVVDTPTDAQVDTTDAPILND